jgi:hypothetical protein
MKTPKKIYIHWSDHKDLQNDSNVTKKNFISNYKTDGMEEYPYILESEHLQIIDSWKEEEKLWREQMDILLAEKEKLKMERDYCSMISTDLLNESKWISVEDESPKFIEGKTYSENVFAICKELQDIQVFAFCRQYDDYGDVFNGWANCYGKIDGDAEWDDNYTITHWKRISKTLPNL